MLKKLLKHEWQTGWKVPTVLVIALLVISVFSGLTFSAPIWERDMGGLELMIVMVWLLYYFALIALNLGVMLYLAVRFYKSMFTDEGYLTHTLPVTARQLLLSKLLPMAAWTAISALTVYISLGIFGGMAVMFLKPEGVGFWEYILEGLSVTELTMLLKENGVISFILSIVFMLIISVFSSPMMIIGSVSLGQMVGKHKILGSIGAYFGINMVVQFASYIVMFPMMFKMVSDDMVNVFDVLTPIYWVLALIMAAVMVGLYFLSEFLIRRKLNLD